MTDATSSFTIHAEPPFEVPQPNCCPAFKVEVDTDNIPNSLLVTYTHDVDCDVWKYLG